MLACAMLVWGQNSIAQPVNDLCENAEDLSGLLGSSDEEQVSDLYTNLESTVQEEDPVPNDPSCHNLQDDIQAPVWFTFEGDGQSYFIRTVECNAAPAYLEDTQMLIGTGGCGNEFNEVACVDDIDAGNNVFEAGLELNTDDGVTYYVMIDGYLGAMNDFCISFTNLSLDVSQLERTSLKMFPNPAQNEVQLAADQNILKVEIVNIMGNKVLTKQNLNTAETAIDISSIGKGVYFVNVMVLEDMHTLRMVKK